MARPRVLYISHNHPSVRPGGAEQYALELYEAMRDSGRVEPVLVAKAGPPVSPIARNREGTIFSRVGSDPNQLFAHTDGTSFDWLLGTSRDKELYTRHFRDFLLALQPDIVHFQHTLFFGYDLIRVVRNTLPDAPILYTLHEFLPICHRNGQMLRVVDERPCLESGPRRCHECFPDVTPQAFFMRKRLIQSHLEMVDRFIAPSRFLLERYVDWGIPRERIMYEEYGRLLAPGQDSPGASGRAPSARRLFGFFGQLSSFKGVNVLLEAMRILQDEGSGTDEAEMARLARPRLRVHGANLELQPGSFRHRFDDLLDRTADTVTFVGPYDARDTVSLMRGVDWVVVPSVWWENSPLVIQEAIAANRPVICSDIGGMAEKVTDGVNGLHFRAGDPVSLARKLLEAAGTDGLWERLRAGIHDVYGMTSHMDVLIALYEELIGERASLAKAAV